jgi:hypothetical protein
MPAEGLCVKIVRKKENYEVLYSRTTVLVVQYSVEHDLVRLLKAPTRRKEAMCKLRKFLGKRRNKFLYSLRSREIRVNGPRT